MANNRRWVAGLLFALPLLVLAACGDDSDGKNRNPILGVWGSRQGTMEGEVWEFRDTGEFELNSYVLQDNTLYREISFAGTFTAANGSLTVTRKTSTCADAQGGNVIIPYTVSGTTLSITVGSMMFAYKKDDAPNPKAQTQVLGCFDQTQNGTFVPRELMNIPM
jgi:hypothetical protein